MKLMRKLYVLNIVTAWTFINLFTSFIQIKIFYTVNKENKNISGCIIKFHFEEC